jgi:quercetin dioxygenase-like cupin family protein
MSTDAMQIAKQIITNRNGLKVVRLNLPKDKLISEHATDADVVIIVVSGAGVFSINGQLNPIKQGDVIELCPGMLHAITASTDLELIVNHMHLNTDKVAMACELASCAE